MAPVAMNGTSASELSPSSTSLSEGGEGSGKNIWVAAGEGDLERVRHLIEVEGEAEKRAEHNSLAIALHHFLSIDEAAIHRPISYNSRSIHVHAAACRGIIRPH